MRHRKKFNHLSRKSEHRKAMLANMAVSLIEHKRITTTVAKAKALRVYVEPLITKAKDDTTHSRRQVFSYLQNKDAISELFRDIAVKIGDRPGGYTRILKTGNRFGDNAEMCIIELVDYNENMLSSGREGAKEKTATRRSRRVKKKTDDTPKSVVGETKRAVVDKLKPVAPEEVAEKIVEVVEERVVEAEIEEPVADSVEETKEEVADESPEEVDGENNEEAEKDEAKEEPAEDDKKD